jgi:hypothetical protein
MRRTLLVQRLLALFVAGWLLFDFPLLRLALVDGSAAASPTLLGMPRLPLLLFVGWGLLIAVLAVWMERAEDEPREGDAEAAASRRGVESHAAATAPEGR